MQSRFVASTVFLNSAYAVLCSFLPIHAHRPASSWSVTVSIVGSVIPSGTVVLLGWLQEGSTVVKAIPVVPTRNSRRVEYP